MEDGKHPLVKLAPILIGYGQRFLDSARTIPVAESKRESDGKVVPSEIAPGYVISQKMTFAYDALRAAALLWTEGHVHFVADYALFRAALECAAEAWWILSAEEQDERARRSVRVLMDDLLRARARESDAVKVAVTAEAREKRSEVRDRIAVRITDLKRAFRDSGLQSCEEIDRERWLSMSDILREAQESIVHIPDVGLTLMWGMLSSIAHGSPSSIDGLSDSSNRPEGIDDRVRFLGNAPDMILSFGKSIFQFVDVVDSLWWDYARLDRDPR